MNQDVPQPGHRDALAGHGQCSSAVRRLSPAARRQHSGCDAISASMLPGPWPAAPAVPGLRRSSAQDASLLVAHVPRPPQVPASPVAATDRTKYRWAAKKISIIGARLITLPAISSVHSVECAPWNVARPSGSVIWLVEVIGDQRPQEVVPRVQERERGQRGQRREPTAAARCATAP